MHRCEQSELIGLYQVEMTGGGIRQGCLDLMVPNVCWSIIESKCLIKSEGSKEVLIESKDMLGLGGV